MERIVGTRRGAKMEKGRGAARSAKGPDEAGLRLLGVVETLVAPFSTLSLFLCRPSFFLSFFPCSFTEFRGVAPVERRGKTRGRKRRGPFEAGLALSEAHGGAETWLNRSGTQAHRWLAGWVGLAHTESPPGHPPRPFTGTEPHPIPAVLICPCPTTVFTTLNCLIEHIAPLIIDNPSLLLLFAKVSPRTSSAESRR